MVYYSAFILAILAFAASSAQGDEGDGQRYFLLGPRNAPNNDLKKFSDTTVVECEKLCNKETRVSDQGVCKDTVKETEQAIKIKLSMN